VDEEQEWPVRNLIAVGQESPQRTRVVIVGGGAAGVITAAHLVRAASPEAPLDVQIIEKGPAIGPGLAYSTRHPLHTLNNFAGRLSAIDDDPDHLLRWCAEQGVAAQPTSFLRRDLYGRYLSGVLDDLVVPRGSGVSRSRGTVTDVREDGGSLTVEVAEGWTVTADRVVLALGNPPPGPQPAYESWGDRFVADPWAADLAERVGRSARVLLLGTGLTMVDVAAVLHHASPQTRLTAVSRRGLLPAAHRRGSARLHDTFDPGVAPLDVLVQRVRRRIDEVEEVGGDWRDVVDAVRACANDLWRGLSAEDQASFARLVARQWETARHRMAPDMAALVRGLQENGTLRVARVEDVDVTEFDAVVNCTGPAPVASRGWNPLVDTLLDRGTLRAHRLGLGLDLTDDGNVVDADGKVHDGLFVVGAARRGIEWEVAAVPDLRRQAATLAEHLVTPLATPEPDGNAVAAGVVAPVG
jgi:uncharacterized NAD(P)/FAD-binding protein YdhS